MSIIKKDYEEVQKSNMKTYYQEVLTNRAVFDPRDGLKPIHRKILFSMLKSGYTHNKKFVKSAKVVGNVIGEYSPHGDEATYMAMIKLAQPWYSNMPLVEVYGNQGSPYGDEPAAYRYCITGDTLILGKDGSLDTIQNICNNISENSEINKRGTVVNKANREVGYSKCFNSGYDDIYMMITNNGYTIRGNANHPIVCYKKTTFTKEWKLLSEIDDKYIGCITITRKDTSNINIRNEVYHLITDFLYEFDFNDDKTSIPLDILNGNAKEHELFIEKILNINDKFWNHERYIENSLYKNLTEYYDIDNLQGTSISSKSFTFLSQLQTMLASIGYVSKIYAVEDIQITDNIISELNVYKTLGELSDKHLGKYIPVMNSITNFNKISPNSYYRLIVDDIDRVHPNGVFYYCDDILGVFKSTQKEMVYSIKVDTDEHDFIGNCFINHNTEARLQKFTENYLLDNLNDTVVDYIPNFDYTTTEPTVLPVKLPMALVNGSFGIAAGYMANIPPHNINEVINATIGYIQNKDNPEYEIELYPDYPSGGIICNTNDIKQYYRDNSSNGKVILRGKIDIDENNNQLIITEIPYMKNSDQIKEQIQLAATEHKTSRNGQTIPKLIDNIKNIIDKSTDGKIKIIIQCTKDANLNVVMNQLYNFTELQTTITINFVGVVNGKFYNYTHVKDLIDVWYQFRIRTLKRIFITDIKNKNYRVHIIDGLLKVLNKENIDKLIKLIRDGKNKQSIIIDIKNEFMLSDKQAEYIINLKLYQINNIEINNIEKEKEKLLNEINELTSYFTNKDKINEYIINELNEINKKVKVPRRTILTNTQVKMKEELIDDSFHTLIVTSKYIKKLNVTPDELTVQQRGGKGKNIGKLKDGDIPISVNHVNNKDNILIFTDKGKVYKRKVYEFESHNINSYGFNMHSIINSDENVTNVLILKDDDFKNEDYKLVIVTKYNKIKLIDISEYANIRTNGTIATKLLENDTVIYVNKVNGSKDYSVFACLSTGRCIRVHINDIPHVNRISYGSSLFRPSSLDKSIYIASVTMLYNKNKRDILFITKEGLGKRLKDSEIRILNRRCSGYTGIRLKNNNDKVVKVISCKKDDNVITLVTNKNIINIPLESVPISLRPAYGVRLKKLQQDEYICNATLS